MSFTSLLIHNCDIGTLSQGAQDAYGTPLKTWPLTHTSEACRLMPTVAREVRVGAMVLVADWKLFVAVVTVDEQDRISNIKDASTGAVIDAGPFEILHVQPRSDGVTGHHLELLLQRVK